MKKNLAALTSLLALGCAVETEVQQFHPPENETKVINGTPAEHYQVPFIVALTKGYNGTSSSCTGTLIKPDYVVTAAHCVAAYPDWVVYGSKDVAEVDPDCLHGISGTEIHPDYSPANYSVIMDYLKRGENVPPGYDTSDLGVILLEKPILGSITADILPEEDYEDETPVGEIVNLCGYGRDENGMAGKLNCGKVPVREHYGSDVLYGENYPDGDNGFPGSSPDACYGDSGGPTITDSGELITATSRLPPGTPGITCGYGYIGAGVGPELNWVEESYQTLKSSQNGGSMAALRNNADLGKDEGDGVCSSISWQEDPERENPKMLSGENRGCSYAPSVPSAPGNGSNPYPALFFLAAGAFYSLRKKSK